MSIVGSVVVPAASGLLALQLLLRLFFFSLLISLSPRGSQRFVLAFRFRCRFSGLATRSPLLPRDAVSSHRPIVVSVSSVSPAQVHFSCIVLLTVNTATVIFRITRMLQRNWLLLAQYLHLEVCVWCDFLHGREGTSYLPRSGHTAITTDPRHCVWCCCYWVNQRNKAKYMYIYSSNRVSESLLFYAVPLLLPIFTWFTVSLSF